MVMHVLLITKPTDRNLTGEELAASLYVSLLVVSGAYVPTQDVAILAQKVDIYCHPGIPC